MTLGLSLTYLVIFLLLVATGIILYREIKKPKQLRSPKMIAIALVFTLAAGIIIFILSIIQSLSA